MRRLFIQLYGVLGLVVVLAVALVGALRQAPEASVRPLVLFSGFSAAATQAMSRADDAQSQDEAVSLLAERFGYPVSLQPRQAVEARLSKLDRRALARGEPVTELDLGGASLSVPLTGQPFVVTLGPVPAPSRALSFWVLMLLFALILVAGAASVLLLPLQRHLSRLANVADSFGAGDLSARVELPASSAMSGLAGSFNAMAERVQALILGRQELLNAVSHELRGPLQRVRFAVELLEDTPDRQQLRQRVRDIQGDVDELDQLVEELLTWSRLQGGAGTLHHESVDVVDLLTVLAEATRRLRPDKDVQLVLDAPPARVSADRRQLHRALTNLCNNAARYAERKVRLTALTDEGRLVVRVDDDGPGVAIDLRERIFEPFVRLDAARSRDAGGIGLGLSIARRIADAHGGTLDVESSDLGGARFVWQMGSHR